MTAAPKYPSLWKLRGRDYFSRAEPLFPEKRKMDEVNNHLDRCCNRLEVLNEQLEKTPFLSGIIVSLAEICCGSILFRLTEQNLDIQLPDQVRQ